MPDSHSLSRVNPDLRQVLANAVGQLIGEEGYGPDADHVLESLQAGGFQVVRFDDVRAALDDADLVRFLTKYGEGPPYLQDNADEVIWRLVSFVHRARRAVGLEPSDA